jgi:KTSC domain
MSLSNCSQCQYYDSKPHHSEDIICAVNPCYPQMWKHLKSLSDFELGCLPIGECREFQLHPDLIEKELTISLPLKQWKDLALSSNNPKILEQLQKQGIDLSCSNNWIDVESSCIKALSFNGTDCILSIRFNSGSIYEYDGVSLILFDSFLDAPSKGRFFNQHIKENYRYRFIS